MNESAKSESAKPESKPQTTRVAAKETPQDELKQAVFVAVVAALATKGTPAQEAAELAQDYAIAAVDVYF